MGVNSHTLRAKGGGGKGGSYKGWGVQEVIEDEGDGERKGVRVRD